MAAGLPLTITANPNRDLPRGYHVFLVEKEIGKSREPLTQHFNLMHDALWLTLQARGCSAWRPRCAGASANVAASVTRFLKARASSKSFGEHRLTNLFTGVRGSDTPGTAWCAGGGFDYLIHTGSLVDAI
ncbi:MAG TPA: hypothetical protein VH934_02990, partial [Xanthobacteraceae bacterium]